MSTDNGSYYLVDKQGYYLYDADGKLIAGDIDFGQNMRNRADELGGYVVDQSTGLRVYPEVQS